MTIRLVLGILSITAAIALTACGGSTKPAAETSAMSATAAASSASVTSAQASANPVVPAAGERPTREFLIGKWGTNGDCTLAIDLRADGTSDGPFGNWTYSDGVIGFVDEPDFKVSVTVIDAQTMESANDGKTSKMTRCP